MKRLLLALLIGVSAFGLMPLSAFADTYPMFGPQSPEDDYLYFGDDTYPRSEQHGITFTVNEASTSFQSIIGAVNLEYVAGSTLIDQREISYFYVLANNRIVDTFEPVRDSETGKWRTNYQLRIALSDWNIGSIVNLQIVAVSPRERSTDWVNYDNHYVVAWSGVQGPIQLKSLPVIDREAITVLEAILAKLEQLKNTLASLLAQIDASIKKIYEVSPQTQAKFDAAMANLQSKLPTEQVKQQANQMQQIVEDSADRINNTPQKIKFGEINWMGVVVTPALDFTQFEQQIKAIRKIAEITLWCEFFYFVILVLRPRLTA